MAGKKSTKQKKKTTEKKKTAFLRTPNKLRKKATKKKIFPINKRKTKTA